MSQTPTFSFELGKNTGPAKRAPRDPLRILVMSDLGETCASRRQMPLANRPFQALDVDTFEEILENEAPEIALSEGALAIRALDDFHPDQIIANAPALQTLLGLRGQLAVPSMFARAAEQVQALLNPATDGAAPDAATGESDADTMSRLFGAAPAEDTDTPPAPGNALDRLIQQAVADHITPSADPKAETYIQAVDAALAAHLRAILHDPAFQSMEAAWRGAEMLASRIETDENLSLHLWNVSKSELLDALGDGDTSPDASLLHRRIVADRADAPFTLIVSDLTFGAGADDMRLLATLGAMAGRTGALVVASVSPSMLGAESWGSMAARNVEDSAWEALRDTGIAQHILALGPGFLARQPYGKKSDLVSAFAFEELDNPASDPFLWGAPSLIAPILIAQSFAEDSWGAALNLNVTFDDLPLVYHDDGGEQVMKPCAQEMLNDSAAQAVLDAGPVPLVAVKNQNAVRLPWFQSIARNGNTGQLGPFST